MIGVDASSVKRVTLLLLMPLLSALGVLLFSNNAFAAKPDITVAEVNDLCSNITEWGYYERMFLTNASGTSLDTSTPITVPLGATSVPVNFKIDMWFCKKRVEQTKYPVKTCRYALVHEATAYTEQDCTGSWNNAPNNLLTNISASSEMHYTSGPKTSPAGTVHYKMATDVHSANLQVSSLKQGANRLCYGNSLTSMDPNGFSIKGGKRCITFVINFGWDTSGTTSLNVNGANRTGTPKVKPGDSVRWSHSVRNLGKGTTNKTIYSRFVNTGRGPSTSDASSRGSGVTAGAVIRSGSDTYTIKASDIGKTICQRISWNPRSSASNSTRSSGNRCVTVPYDFNLRPIISNPPNNLTPGQPIAPISPKVENDGPTKSLPGVQWQLTRFELNPGVTKPGNTQNGTSPCSYFSNGCVVKDSGTRTFPDGTTVLNALAGETVRDDMPVGGRVCFGLSVQPYAENTSNWRHYSVCITINKHPSIQVWGGDLRAGGDINTSISRGVNASNAPASFGSWVEYGVFSRGVNEGLSSGSYLVDGDTASDQDARHKLTFANRGGSYGKYNFNTSYNIATQFAPSGSTRSAGSSLTIGGATPSGTYLPTGGSLSIRGTVAQGRHIIVYAPSATVTITDDVNYGGSPYSSLNQIPQLVIVADRIRIQQDVRNVDAWLLAGDYIDTCSNIGTAGVMPTSGTLSDSICDERLNINGPVSTNRLILKRTAGSDKGSYGEPAEVFNLRSDSYLWRYLDAAADGQVRVISVKELPPRF